MIDMAKKEILPAAAKYIKDIAKTAELAKSCGAETVFEEETVKEISALVTEMYKHLAHWKLMYRKYTLSRTHRNGKLLPRYYLCRYGCSQSSG